MRSFGRFLALLLVTAIMTGNTQAAPITYDEAVQGDLEFGFVGTLGVGVNNVSGTIHFRTGGDFDFDLFSFAIPVGTRLVGASYTFSPTFTNIGGAAVGYDLGQLPLSFPAPPPLDSQLIDLLSASSPVLLFANALPLEAGSYGLTRGLLSLDCLSEGPCSWQNDYTWALTVASENVPEPPSYVLISLALAALGFACRRKRL